MLDGTHHQSGRVTDGVVFAGETLEDTIYRWLTLGAGNFVVSGFARKETEHRQEQRYALAVVEVLKAGKKGDKEKKSKKNYVGQMQISFTNNSKFRQIVGIQIKLTTNIFVEMRQKSNYP